MPDLPIWVYFERDLDLDGIWVAHVLDLDLVTQGDSLRDAIDMAVDAAITVLAAALEREPNSLVELFAKRRAPKDDWDKLWALFERAPARPLSAIVDGETEFSAMGTQLNISAAAVCQRAFGNDGNDNDPADEPTPSMPVGAVRKCA